MTRDELKQLILATFLAPYGEYATPALVRQFGISAGLAADRILAGDQTKRPPARVVTMRRAG